MATARKRGAHRGFVKRKILECEVMFEKDERKEERLDLSKAKQLRILLQEKMEVIGRLDDEMLNELDDETAMEADIEEADSFRQKIRETIDKLDVALAPPSKELPLLVEPGAVSRTRPIRPKLPELTIKRFDGDITMWKSFWDTYKSAVHDNESLSDIDKFTYLQSLVSRSAKDAIDGLPLTADNYSEAVTILQKRFGNDQLIISKHMETLLGVEAVHSSSDIGSLRRMYDRVESHIRGLKSLGITSRSYGALLAPVLQNKLPSDLRLIINRELTEEWDLDKFMKTLATELEVRERSAAIGKHESSGKLIPNKRGHSTTTSLVTGSQSINCVYCQQNHASAQCRSVTEVETRRHILKSTGRCFLCLKRGHITRNCQSDFRCAKCKGMHNTSLCYKKKVTFNESVSSMSGEHSKTSTSANKSSLNPQAPVFEDTHTYTTLSAGGDMEVLLQTAQAVVYNPLNKSKRVVAQLILDGGSHRSYVTDHIRKSLGLKSLGKKQMSIMTFGSMEEQQECHLVRIGIQLKDGGRFEIPILAVPLICDSLAATPIQFCIKNYSHLQQLDTTDMAQDGGSAMAPQVLIGSDFYWQLVTGRLIRGECGPVALQTRLGWVLTGLISSVEQHKTATMMTFALQTSANNNNKELERRLRAFWDLESLGVLDQESSLYEQFKRNIVFRDGRYEVPLPWRSPLQDISCNYQLCLRRLRSQLRRLQRDPRLLREYDGIIQGQLKNGIIEQVPEPEIAGHNKIHYLPHHAVIRQDKETTKVRIVYDASAKSEGASLNECLHIGPKFNQRILEILLRFRFYRIALIADIEKAFLMVSIDPKDRDVLRFLWYDKIDSKEPEVKVFRFKRVVFGVASSPFLLNATVRNHMEGCEELFPSTVAKLMNSMYVDDMVCGANTEGEAYTLYLESKDMLARGGFNLRKFITNNINLQNKINERERLPQMPATECKVLGTRWEVESDSLVFDVSEVVANIDVCSPTKRSVVGVVSRFYDPIGILSPVIIVFKIFLQELTKAGMSWDEPLTDSLLERWRILIQSLQTSPPIIVPRFYLCSLSESDSYYLCGFCDASSTAYAAVIYLVISHGGVCQARFVTSKTRVAPINAQTIPRLELIGALLLSRLMNTVTQSFEGMIHLQEPLCYTDSKIALYWIYGLDRDWKPFVQNRTEEIRKLIPPTRWKHCPGRDNPSDLPSRGISMLELKNNTEWFNGPNWLSESEIESHTVTEMPEECAIELRAHERKQTLSLLITDRYSLSRIIDIKKYSSLNKLLRVTINILKFICILKSEEIDYISLKTQAEALWIKESQSTIVHDKKFEIWKKQLRLFIDDKGLWRCGGRLSNASLPYSAKHPILLFKGHPLSNLIVKHAHERVLHNGVKETLVETRSRYWIPQGRSFVKQTLFHCTICRRFGALSYSAPPPPPLPPFRVQEEPPFTFSGVDFAGPLYVKAKPPCKGEDKVWICLFTCCIVRAIHLEIVVNLTVPSFIRCLKRFVARRGLPKKILSDNGKTFKGAAKVIRAIMGNPEVREYLSGMNLEWQFNVERAPWWGGVFERMIGSTKKCLRKMIGRSKLTLDELTTAVAEVEMILNSRPITYLSSDDLDEPLTPSHLIVGRRLLNLPDNLCYEQHDIDYSPQSTTEVLTRRMKHLSNTLDRFWNRWTKEYLIGLREGHSYVKQKRSSSVEIHPGDVVVIHEDKKPRGFWSLGKVEQVLPGRDDMVRSATVRVFTGGRRSKLLRRPIQRLYPIELSSRLDAVSEAQDSSPHSVPDIGDTTPVQEVRRRTTRGAALEARDRMIARSLAEKEL